MGNRKVGGNSCRFWKKINSQLLSEKKWAFILIFFILLFNPVFYFWADNINIKDKYLAWLICIIVGFALSFINLFLKKRGEKIYLSILFALSATPNIIVWTYLFISNTYMSQDMYWVIIDTNSSETAEYFNQFIPWQSLLTTLIYITLGIFLIVKTRSKQSISLKKHWTWFSLSVIIVLSSIFLQYLAQAMPVVDFYRSNIMFLKERREFDKEKEIRKKQGIDVRCALPDSTNHLFVVVIGESMSTCHISRYGYFRETTPVMDSLSGEFDVYTDVITPDTYTVGVMKKALSFADSSHPEYYTLKPSIIELFNTAGFETYWISNQNFLDKWRGSHGAVAQQAKHIYNLAPLKQHDEILIPYLQEALHDSISGNKIIFVHLKGSHHTYNCRYPKDFDYFNCEKRGDLVAGFRNDYMKKTIDEYDNSIRYTDFVLGSIFRQIKDLNTSSCLLFFSDHGEEVYDTRTVGGHFMSNVHPCQCKIPFILWRSEKYRENVSDLVIDISRPYSIEDVIYSLSTLCCLEYEGNNPARSIFSAEYKIPSKRMVGKENYENILKK